MLATWHGLPQPQSSSWREDKPHVVPVRGEGKCAGKGCWRRWSRGCPKDANVRRPEIVKGLKDINVIMIAAGARHTVAVGYASTSSKEAEVNSCPNCTFSLESSQRASELEDIDSDCVPTELLQFFSWGSALHGQLGTGRCHSSFVPQKIKFP